MSKNKKITRRSFFNKTAAGLAFTIVPRHVLGGDAGPAPSDRPVIGCIAAGGMGKVDIDNIKAHCYIHALADVDWNNAAGAFNEHPGAKRYKDFRIMLDEVGGKLDGVTVSTPDHNHAIAAVAAMRRGKHVYCQKPLAHSIYEVRQMQQAARKYGVITQMGNQGHSSHEIRACYEWVRDGAIGAVHTVHAFCDINWSRIGDLPRLAETHPVPESLDWDLWQGPAGRRAYHPMLMPGNWRGWAPYGGGTVGDWVCHVVDPAFWALDLGAPRTIKAEAKNYDPKAHALTFAPGTRIEYEFAATATRPAVKLVWFDGESKPPRPEALEEGRDLPGIGAVFYGDKGTLMHGSHGAGGLQLLPVARMKEYKKPEPSLARIPGGHWVDWINAIKENRPACSPFDYGAPLTEIALLGLIALRHPGQTLEWDGVSGRFTNHPQANWYIRPDLHNGWRLDEV